MTDAAFREQCSRQGAAYYQKHRAKILERQKAYVKRIGRGNVQLGHLTKRLKEKFGISLDEYNALLAAQDYRCQICGGEDRSKSRRLAVDHDHASGTVRALLCHHCNTGLGNFKDDPVLMWKALQYIMKHQRDSISEVS